MKKDEFLERLAMSAEKLSEQERYSLLEYFDELICDRKEDGEEEEAIIASFGAPEEIARMVEEERPRTEEQHPFGEGMEGNSPKEKLRMNPGEGKRYFAPKDVHTVRLRAENRGVDVLLTQEEQISVEFIPVEGKDEVEVYDKDGEFFFCQRMRFRPIADVWSLLKSGRKGNRIILYIPGSYQGRIVIRDGNSSVNVRGLSRISELEVTTSNSSISCLDTQVNGRTKLWTGNSSVTVSQWEGEELDVKTSNGRIRLDHVRTPGRVTAKTSNSAVEADRVDASEIYLKTSNGKITGSVAGDLSQYDIVSKTGNASSNLPSMYHGTGERKLSAETSNGKIQIQFERG